MTGILMKKWSLKRCVWKEHALKRYKANLTGSDGLKWCVYKSEMSDRPSGAERGLLLFQSKYPLLQYSKKQSQQNLLPTVLFSSTTHGEFSFLGLSVYPLNQEPLRRDLISALYTNSVCVVVADTWQMSTCLINFKKWWCNPIFLF